MQENDFSKLILPKSKSCKNIEISLKAFSSTTVKKLEPKTSPILDREKPNSIAILGGINGGIYARRNGY